MKNPKLRKYLDKSADLNSSILRKPPLKICILIEFRTWWKWEPDGGLRTDPCQEEEYGRGELELDQACRLEWFYDFDWCSQYNDRLV